MSLLTVDSSIHEQLSEWNKAHPDGTEVTFISSEGDLRTRTRGNAIALNGRLMVHLQGVEGAVHPNRPASDYMKHRTNWECASQDDALRLKMLIEAWPSLSRRTQEDLVEEFNLVIGE